MFGPTTLYFSTHPPITVLLHASSTRGHEPSVIQHRLLRFFGLPLGTSPFVRCFHRVAFPFTLEPDWTWSLGNPGWLVDRFLSSHQWFLVDEGAINPFVTWSTWLRRRRSEAQGTKPDSRPLREENVAVGTRGKA